MRAAAGGSARGDPSAAAWAGSARPVIIWRRVVSRREIGRRRVIRPPVITIVVGRRRERHEWCCDDRRGSADDGACHADRPEQRKRRARGIILRIGGRERQCREPGGDRGRNRYSADAHGGLRGWTGRSRYPGTGQTQITLRISTSACPDARD